MEHNTGARRFAAVLAADVIGFSRMMGEDEDGTLKDVTAARDIWLGIVDRYAGRVVGAAGDSVLAEFADPGDALHCAVAIHCALEAAQPDPAAKRRIRLRIGVNLGEVIPFEDTIHGDDVNLAVRLESVAPPGGVCISHKVHDRLRDRLVYEIEDGGEQSLKNIRQPVRAYMLRNPTVGPSPAPPSGAAKPAGASRTAFAGTEIRSAIAVMPFADRSGDPEREYFADGVTADIIAALASWKAVPVVARNSSFAFKDKTIDAKQLGRELGARYLVEGEIRRLGPRLRATVLVVDAEAGDQIFADKFDRQIEDLFELQDEIVQAIVGAIAPEVLRSERDRAARKPLRDLTAYDLLQRGLWHHYKFTREDNARAQDLFRQAIAADSNLAQAWAALSIALMVAAQSKWVENQNEVFEEALALGRRAVELDERDPMAHQALGAPSQYLGRVRFAIGEYEQAVKLNPSFAIAHANLAALYSYVGDPRKGEAAARAAIKVSPRDPRRFIFFNGLGIALYLQSRFEEAHEAFGTSLAVRPSNAVALRDGAACLGRLGRRAEAEAYLAELRRVDPDFRWSIERLRRLFDWPEGYAMLLGGLERAGLDTAGATA